MEKFIKASNGIIIPVDLVKFYGTDTFFPTDKDLKKVDKHTRAGKKGKLIVCPECKNIERVYHFAWSAIICPKCNKVIDKYDYYVFCKLKENENG